MTVGAVTLLVWATACSQADDDPTGDGRSATTEASSGDDREDGDSTATTGDERGSAGGEGERSGEGEGEGTGEVLGSATARLPADPNDDTPVALRLDVTALERLSGRVEARFLLTNTGAAGGPTFEPWSSFVDPRLGADEAPWSLAGASLIDGEAQQAYLTIIDSEGMCLCSGDLDSVTVPPGESVELYADFGGVPDDVERLDVQVPGFSPVTEVAIS